MTDHDDHPHASPEARDAIKRARRAKASTEATLPVIEEVARRVRAVTDANHFTELLEETIREAAQRKPR